MDRPRSRKPSGIDCDIFRKLELQAHSVGRDGHRHAWASLVDLVRKLATIADDLAGDSPMHQKITDQIKAEIFEYFEREKNPPYDADRRFHKGHTQNGKSSCGV